MSFDKILLQIPEPSDPPDQTPSPMLDSNRSKSMQRFLGDYPAQYFSLEGRRTHFVDTGEGQYQRTVLCLHSRLGWAYSFRKIIPKLVYHGYRVVAVDMLGFGLSEKFEDQTLLAVRAQAKRIKALIEYLQLSEVTIIGHEMGAGIAAQLPHMLPETVEALVFANPAARLSEAKLPGLHLWRTLINMKSKFNVGAEIARICPNLTADEIAAYNSPLLTVHGMEGLRHFHETVVLGESNPDYNFVNDGYRWLRDNWKGRSLVLVGMEDTVFGLGTAKHFSSLIGCPESVVQLDGVCGHPFEQTPDCIDTVVNMLFSAR